MVGIDWGSPGTGEVCPLRKESRLMGGAEPNRPGPRLRVADRRERTDAAQLAVSPGELNESGETE